MKHLFGPPGERALAAFARSPYVLAFDFDGTLCELHAEPDRSRTLPVNLPLLKRLNAKVPLAIITGRSKRDIRPKLGFTPRYVIGNHGLEGLDPRAGARAVEIVRGWRRQLAETWAPFTNDAGVFVEDKVFSLSLHYRLGADPRRARRLLRDRIARLTPTPRVIGGKFIFNLTLARSAHKGTALLEVMEAERCSRALFVGDDVTDEFAFQVRRPGLLKVRVGASRRSAADWYVRDLAGVTRLLARLDSGLR